MLIHSFFPDYQMASSQRKDLFKISLINHGQYVIIIIYLLRKHTEVMHHEKTKIN